MMSKENEIANLLVQGRSPAQIAQMGYSKSTVYQVYGKVRSTTLAQPLQAWQWVIRHTFDKNRYLPGESGYVDIGIRNTGGGDIFLSQVGLQFDWMGDSWFAAEVKVLLRSGEETSLPRLFFNVQAGIPLGSHGVRFGATTHVWHVTGWLNYGTFWADWGTVEIKYPRRSYSVFVSHSVGDHNLIQSLTEILDVYGLNPVVAERQSQPGTPLASKVAALIDGSDCVIALLTTDGATKEWVNQEIGYARRAGKLIVPLLEEGVEAKGFLEGVEWVRFSRTDPLRAFSSMLGWLTAEAGKKEAQARAGSVALAAVFLGFLILLASSK